jgi:hypothetical protein
MSGNRNTYHTLDYMNKGERPKRETTFEKVKSRSRITPLSEIDTPPSSLVKKGHRGVKINCKGCAERQG